jgi:phosphate/phosphite/phosphonate ABC transporter binding protein
MTEVVVFGYAAHGASTAMRERVAQFSLMLGRLAHVELAVYEAESYEDLARAMVTGEVDIGWLPPLAFIALERKALAVPLVSAQRGGDTAFYSALIVASSSELNAPEDLAGARAAWVDPYSASGYVVPRAGLAAVGIDPRVAFSEERFLHSHEAVVRAVVAGRADFGATYAGVDTAGQITRGAWMDVQGADEAIRVLVRFGAIPGDVIAARGKLAAPTRDALTRALLAISREPAHRALLGEAFGIDDFRRWVSAGYDALRRLAEDASKRGLLEGDADPDDDDDDDLDDEEPSDERLHDDARADEGLAETNEDEDESLREPNAGDA